MSKKIIRWLGNPILQNSFAIVVTSFFLIFIILFFLLPAKQKAEDDAVNLQQKTAIDAQHLIDLFMQIRFEDLENTGNHLWFHHKNADHEDIKAASEIFFYAKTDFINISLLDHAGKTILSIDKPGVIVATPSSSLKNSLSFKKPFEEAVNYISPVYFGSHGPSIQISIPLREDGKIIGAIIADIDFTLLWKVVKTPEIVDGKIYLVDTRGYIIADPDLNRSVSGENLKYRDIINKIVAGENKVPLAIYINENYIPVLSYGLKIPLTGWGIIVEQKLSTALLQKNLTSSATFGFSAISIVLILLLLLGTYRLSKALIKVEREEETISAERNKLAVILSGISDAVIALDSNRNIVTFNKTAEKLTGYNGEDVIGKYIGDIINVYETNTPLAPETYSPIQSNTNEGVVFSKSGLKIKTIKKEAYVNLLVGHISEGLAVNLGCILTMHDITEETQLEHMKLDFVSMAAHELRTPLTTIKNYLSVFIEENSAKLGSEQNNFLKRIDVATQQLASLIENLLNASKVERNAFVVNLAPTDLVSIAKQITIDLTSKAAEKKITLKFVEPKNHIPKVMANKLRLSEVLGNLLSNAIAYTKPKGKITVTVTQNGNEVVTNVADTGEGIPKEAIPHLFTKFFRVSADLEQEGKGTGLGLYISKSIIDMHHGRIWVESELGKGSIFSFSIPTKKI